MTTAERGAAGRLLIALDIDGTVLLEDGSPSPGVVEAVQAATAAGHEVTLATGRSWSSTQPVLEQLGITPDYVVSANGATVYRRDGDGYTRFHTETFDPAPVLERLVAHLPDAHYMVELADGTQLYTEQMDVWGMRTAREATFAELSAQPVTRVVVVSPGQDEGEFVRLVEEIGLHQVSYAIGWTAWLDIAPHGVDKGSSLQLVCDWLGHDPARTIVIGDGRNDLGMFAWAREREGMAVAMGQAPDEVKDQASLLTHTVERGGVAHVINTMVLA